MSLNIEVKFSETAEASALAPMELEIVNADSLPCAFKLNLLHPHRYITNISHGIILPKRSKKILLRLRAPHELKKDGHSMVPSILKASSGGKGPRSRSPGGDQSAVQSSPPASPTVGSGTVETTEIAKLDVRVITALIADPATEADFLRYWPTAFHHSNHTIPFTAIFLSEEEFFAALMKKQEALLNEAEAERADLRKTVDGLKATLKSIDERNLEFSKDLDKIRKRSESSRRSEYLKRSRIRVPVAVGLLAVLASMFSAANIALSVS
ncbi:transmembrane protein, putative [Bodo saltans]|uniref:Transmembrane protein, putative n=1 Tax=Bodo saltans TaxID=75058 RepID=A0A0S4JUZ2_BODSA|nr:transmembrane protein, putative [Bodo saltans]|eukprot:CUG94060.1 transmembrane protein, putative [Bodo saltans]